MTEHASQAASPTFNPAYMVARCGLLRVHAPHVSETGPDRPRNCPGVPVPKLRCEGLDQADWPEADCGCHTPHPSHPMEAKA
jgi:hypothetical protein